MRTHLVNGWHYHAKAPTERCWRAYCGYEFTGGLLAGKDAIVCRNCERTAKRLRREGA